MATLLGNLEFMVLLAAMRLGDEAYGVPIAKTLKEGTSRDWALASIYAALERLETKGLVTSEMGESTPERGGRAKRYFRVTTKGVRVVQETQRTFVELWRGLPDIKLESST